MVLRPGDEDAWHMCLGNDPDDKFTGLAVMGRKFHSEKLTPCINDVDLLHCETITAKGNNSTGIMVVEVRGVDDLVVRIINVHFHHNTAKKATGHKEKYKQVLDTIARCIAKYDAQLLIGDFNQAAPTMVMEMEKRFGLHRRSVFADSHHPRNSCICIFSLGGVPPGNDSDISKCKHLNGAHWPLARNFGVKPKRTAEAMANRRTKAHARWDASKKKTRRKR